MKTSINAVVLLSAAALALAPVAAIAASDLEKYGPRIEGGRLVNGEVKAERVVTPIEKVVKTVVDFPVRPLVTKEVVGLQYHKEIK